MAVTRLSQSSLREGLEKYTTALGNYVPSLGVLDNIQTITVGAGGAANVTFSSIPQNFQHLQIRGICLATAVAHGDLRINGDTANNYAYHGLEGNGASASAFGFTTQPYIASVFRPNTTATDVSSGVIDILDYSSTSKNKTVRYYRGLDANGSGVVMIASGLWLSAAAVTSLSIVGRGGNLGQHSTFALYGVVAR